ncbi:MAG TPA: DJ-1/PfpI family protein [Verrucomicrobiae bacterium]|nr:DJ-1/PfpI family protein [Verrucomicrobiae bacterium]
MSTSAEKHINIGALVFPQMDQIDLTGPFEVLSRLPNSTFHLVWKELTPVRDNRGLLITPEMTFGEAPPLDLLVVPGGFGQEALMDDDVALKFIQAKAATASYVFSICTGALLCGAAGLLRGVKSTTHWSAFHLLPYFGAIPVNARVVVDGKHVSAAGVTAGLDGALRVAVLMRGERVAQQIQLGIEYAPDPPFRSGTPQTAPPEVLQAARASVQKITDARLITAQRVAARLGINVD